MNENMQSSYTYIIGLEFNAARNNIAIEQTTNPDNGFIQLHQNYIDFLTVIIGEDLIFFENYKFASDNTSKKINSLYKNLNTVSFNTFIISL